MYRFDRNINETSGLDTSSTSLLTYLTKFKLADVINLTCWFDQIDEGTTMVPIENNFGSITNIKYFPSSYITKWKS